MAELVHYIVLFGAAMLAGAVNSVAGGGTLLTFPALLWAGYAARIANATSTVALWPGQLSSLFGYRREIGENRAAIFAFGIPSLAGGYIGAKLLLHTDNATFARLVPFLILAATCLFMAQEPISRLLKRQAARAAAVSERANGGTGEQGNRGTGEQGTKPNERAGERENPSFLREGSQTGEQVVACSPVPLFSRSAFRWLPVMAFQLVVAIYGGYFGAGIGILMLAALGFMGFTNIHQMNGLKNINGLLINGVAACMFIAQGIVSWRIAALMAAGSIVGGYTGAGTARRIGQRNVRRLIIVLGFGLTLSLLIKH